MDAPDQTGQVNCVLFLQCLAQNPTACPTRNAPGCREACDPDNSGGSMGSGMSQASRVLENAGCQL